ncbi:MAG: hypothetical protein V7745_01725 [Pseudomonadales bacterium]
MNVSPALQAGLSGISRGFEGLQEASSNIAKAGASTPESNNTAADLTQSFVDLQDQSQATQASVKVVNSASEVLGTLLDVSA